MTELCLLHGAMSDKAVWERTAHRLATAGRRVLNIDLPGHGERADEDPGRADLRTFASDLQACPVETDGPVLIGWSLGASVALRAVLDGMDVQGLVLVGAAPQAVADATFMHALPEEAARQRDEGLAKAYPATARLFARQVAGADKDARAAVEAMALRTPAETARRVFAASWSDGLTAELHKVMTPTVLIHGTDDRVCPLAGAEEMAGRLAGLRGFEIVEGAGHAPMLTHGAAFDAALDRALNLVCR